MEPLAKSSTSPGVDAAARLVASFAEHPELADRYPNGTIFIASDLPDASQSFERAMREKKPVAIVFPDGSDVVGRPPEGPWLVLLLVLALGWLTYVADRRRVVLDDKPLYFPRSWATEVHPAPPRELVGA